MKDISKVITNSLGPIIVLILILTIIFGFFATSIEIESDWRSFLPDDNREVDAYFEIIDEYGNIEYVQILVIAEDGDVLTTSVFDEMMTAEMTIYQDATINSTLLRTSQNPTGIISVADINNAKEEENNNNWFELPDWNDPLGKGYWFVIVIYVLTVIFTIIMAIFRIIEFLEEKRSDESKSNNAKEYNSKEDKR